MKENRAYNFLFFNKYRTRFFDFGLRPPLRMTILMTNDQ